MKIDKNIYTPLKPMNAGKLNGLHFSCCHISTNTEYF